MASKTYMCKVEVTTKPQSDEMYKGRRLTFRPGDIIESKFLRGQTERLIGMGVIEEIKKLKAQPVVVDAEIEEDNGT